MLFDLGDDTPYEIHGDSETDALGARVLRQHGRIDADQLADAVDQRAARIARVDRCVRLDEILERH